MRAIGYYLQKSVVWLKVRMIYDDVPVVSKVASYCNQFLKNPFTMSETFQDACETFQDASKMVDLQLEAPTLTHFTRFG